ncbi:hypothetical protein Phage2-1_00061 [Achromobacter phage 2-1]|nr:hypothetical protein Phage2-1_00061 [Achromobacter phage 2-1]
MSRQEDIISAKRDLAEAQELIKSLPEDQRKLGQELSHQIADIVKNHGALGVLALSVAGLAVQLTILEEGE